MYTSNYLVCTSLLHSPVAVGGQAGPGNLCTAGYVKTVYRKLEVSSRAEATREAMRMGMIDS